MTKAIQWYRPNLYGMNKFVAMMGGCHVEQAALGTIGDWLRTPEWGAAITAASVSLS